MLVQPEPMKYGENLKLNFEDSLGKIFRALKIYGYFQTFCRLSQEYSAEMASVLRNITEDRQATKKNHHFHLLYETW